MQAITVNNFKTDFGTLGRDGKLGYRDYIVSLDPFYKDWEVLGIHANSEVSLSCHETAVLCGGLNGTGMYYDRSPRVRFFIDGVPFGETERPQQMTDPIVLTKGHHILHTKLIDPAPNIAHFWLDGIRETLAHTVWAWRKKEFGERRKESGGSDGRYPVFSPNSFLLATRENTLFVSAAAFGNEVEAKTKLFRESAVEYGIPYEFFDTDKRFTSFFDHKIKNFLDHLHLWKQRGIEYVFSLDCRDIVFRHPVDIILGKFNAIYDGRVIIAKDVGGVTHPLFIHWFPGHLQQMVGKDCEINTGVIAGHVDDLIKVYSNIPILREEYLSGIARNEVMAKVFVHQKNNPPHMSKLYIQNDDQALHFLNILTHPEWYRVDAHKVLSAFISDFPSDPKLCDPPHKLNSICGASILHASCPATRGQWEKMCKKRWWEEDENKREQIPVQIPALELNAVYTCNLRCEYCPHLGRYVKGSVPLETMKGWLHSWRNKVLPCTVRILGGEPLLHQDIDRIVYAVYETWAEAQRIIVTNGLIERHETNFVHSLRETNTHLWVSVHHDSPQMNRAIDANIAKWRAAGLTVTQNWFTFAWKKCYRMDNGKPVPFDTHPKTAWDHCRTQRNRITLLDNQLFMCPKAALFQYAYNHQFVGEEWKLAADYKPLAPTCTWRELVDFVECTHEQSICRMCPGRRHHATPQEKANVHGLENPEYLTGLLQ